MTVEFGTGEGKPGSVDVGVIVAVTFGVIVGRCVAVNKATRVDVRVFIGVPDWWDTVEVESMVGVFIAVLPPPQLVINKTHVR